MLSTDKIKYGSEAHRQKVRAWQALAVLSSWVPATDSTTDGKSEGEGKGEGGGELERAARAVLGHFTLNEAPSVKQFQEAVAAALLLKRVGDWTSSCTVLPEFTEGFRLR